MRYSHTYTKLRACMHTHVFTHIRTHTEAASTLSAAGQLPMSALRSENSPRKGQQSQEDVAPHSNGGLLEEDAPSGNTNSAQNNGAKDLAGKAPAGAATYVYETPRDSAVGLCPCVCDFMCCSRRRGMCSPHYIRAFDNGTCIKQASVVSTATTLSVCLSVYLSVCLSIWL